MKVVDPLFGAARGRRASSRRPGTSPASSPATDLEVGVHKAPANRRIEWAVDASVSVGDEEHAHPERERDQRAARRPVGAGCACRAHGPSRATPDWRFVNVRRLISMIEKALESALQWAVFEPNDVFTRARATMSVTIFLARSARARACSRAPRPRSRSRSSATSTTTRTRSATSAGSSIEISVAPSKPFEFVVLRVGRVRDALEVTDAADGFSISGTGGADGARRAVPESHRDPVGSAAQLQLPRHDRRHVELRFDGDVGRDVARRRRVARRVLRVQRPPDGDAGRQAARGRPQQHRAPLPDPDDVAEHHAEARRVAHLARAGGTGCTTSATGR